MKNAMVENRHEVRVLFFGHLVDVTGCEAWEVKLPMGAMAGDALVACYAMWPGLEAHDGSISVAVEQAFADRGTVLPLGAEVALMPPVQGG